MSEDRHTEAGEERCCERCGNCSVHGYRPGRALDTITYRCGVLGRHVGPHFSCPDWVRGDPWRSIKR